MLMLDLARGVGGGGVEHGAGDAGEPGVSGVPRPTRGSKTVPEWSKAGSGWVGLSRGSAGPARDVREPTSGTARGAF
eukprot:scaffold121702_cov51-Phaeocystis_antarctica.AAC.1